MGQIRLGQPVNRRLGDLLVAEGLVKQEELQRALAEQKGTTEKLGSVLVRLKLVNEEQLTGFLSRQYGIPSITLSQLDIDPGILRLVPPQIARKYEVLPVKRAANTLTLAMADPTNVFALDDVSFMTNLQVLPVVAAQAAIRRAIEREYESQGAAITDVLTELAEDQASNVEVVDDDEDSGGKVDVFELKESADEAPVVKLVNMVLVDAIQKGASDIHWEPYEKAFRVRFRIDGVLHEMLTPPKRLESAIVSRLKIMSSLDIAERRVPQDGRIKLRYHTREIDFRVSILPTLFGETRDLETAQISIRAALTGHLVFSTLHTNDSPSTVARLIDMGIPPFLVASSLLLVMAQRLGRKVCKDCKEPYEVDEDSLLPYGHVLTGVGRTQFYKGRGCAACNFTGMKGRVAIYEVMPASQEIRDLILKNAPVTDIRAMAQAQGMKSLRQAGLLKVLEGTTTVEEVLRVTVAE